MHECKFFSKLHKSSFFFIYVSNQKKIVVWFKKLFFFSHSYTHTRTYINILFYNNKEPIDVKIYYYYQKNNRKSFQNAPPSHTFFMCSGNIPALKKIQQQIFRDSLRFFCRTLCFFLMMHKRDDVSANKKLKYFCQSISIELHTSKKIF